MRLPYVRSVLLLGAAMTAQAAHAAEDYQYGEAIVAANQAPVDGVEDAGAELGPITAEQRRRRTGGADRRRLRARAPAGGRIDP